MNLLQRELGTKNSNIFTLPYSVDHILMQFSIGVHLSYSFHYRFMNYEITTLLCFLPITDKLWYCGLHACIPLCLIYGNYLSSNYNKDVICLPSLFNV